MTSPRLLNFHEGILENGYFHTWVVDVFSDLVVETLCQNLSKLCLLKTLENTRAATMQWFGF